MNNSTEKPKRGEIWLIDWNPSRGSEQSGLRPSVIIQNDYGNSNDKFPNTIITTISTKGRNIPFHIQLTPNNSNRLTQVSFIKTEQILTISKERLIKKLGTITSEELKAVNEGIKILLNIG
ncbi:MAG: type II toxin-antitoxin system PemK/MazF family toxin [Candidatus Nanoarchaeia archaeon]